MIPLSKTRLQPSRHPASHFDTPPAWRRLATLLVLLPGIALAASAAKAGDRDGTYHDAHKRDRSAEFQQADSNKDGKLSRAEFEGVSNGSAPEVRASAANVDKLQPVADSGRNTANDMKQRGAGDTKQWDKTNLFQRADTDNNGQLSRAEFEAITGGSAETIAENARPAVREATTLNDFDEKDQDGDGKLSREELYGRPALNASNDD